MFYLDLQINLRFSFGCSLSLKNTLLTLSVQRFLTKTKYVFFYISFWELKENKKKIMRIITKAVYIRETTFYSSKLLPLILTISVYIFLFSLSLPLAKNIDTQKNIIYQDRTAKENLPKHNQTDIFFFFFKYLLNWSSTQKSQFFTEAIAVYFILILLGTGMSPLFSQYLVE